MSDTVPAWAREHLQQNVPADAVLNATMVGSRRVLANTRHGAVLVRRSFFGGITHVQLERPRPRVRFGCPRCGEAVQSFTPPPLTLRCDGCGASYVAGRDGQVTDSMGARIRTGRVLPAPHDADPTATSAMGSTGATPSPEVSAPDDGEEAGDRETDVAPTGTSQGKTSTTDGDATDYRPQCVALTADGGQCRNSARSGSKYCSSHKGYQPPGARQVAELLDTAPGHEVSGDGLLAVRGRAGAIIPGEQCSAVTAAGAQCRNTARSGSKYCPSHRNYQPPTVRLVAARRDTAPRVANAPDTLPAVRRSRKTK